MISSCWVKIFAFLRIFVTSVKSQSSTPGRVSFPIPYSARCLRFLRLFLVSSYPSLWYLLSLTLSVPTGQNPAKNWTPSAAPVGFHPFGSPWIALFLQLSAYRSAISFAASSFSIPSTRAKTEVRFSAAFWRDAVSDSGYFCCKYFFTASKVGFPSLSSDKRSCIICTPSSFIFL